MDGRSDASLDRVHIVEVLGSQPVGEGIERNAALLP
jgi:hypothetical protein